MSENKEQGLSGEEAARNMPAGFNDVQLGGSKGLLSGLGDPAGNALNTGLKPLGNAVGGLTNGGYTQAKEMDRKAAGGEEEKGIGGKEQNGQNPLGL